MGHPRLEPSLIAQWERIRGRLRSELGETDFRNWIGPMVPEHIVGGTLRLGLPSRFMRDMVDLQYREVLRSHWSRENADVRAIELAVTRPSSDGMVGIDAPDLAAPSVAPLLALQGTTGSVRSVTEGDEDGPGSPLDPRMTFESFVKDGSNELAQAAARQVAAGASQGLNPLFLWGGVGLGKTHLLHAIGWETRARLPGQRVLLLTAERFMVQFVQALRNRDTGAFKQALRSVDVLMIDDLQFIAGKDVTQDEFLHTFDALVDQRRQVVLTADQPPSAFAAFGERLKTRLQQGLVAQILPATLDLRRAFLDRRTANLPVTLPAPVLDFLAQKISGNIRELEGAMNRVVADTTLCGRAVSLERTQTLLVDLLRAGPDRRVTIDDIQRRVADHYGIRLADMTSARRARAVARPRQVAMYLAKQLTPRSLPEIGKKFGGRDHTTVMHAVRKIETLKAADAAMADDVELLRRLIES